MSTSLVYSRNFKLAKHKSSPLGRVPPAVEQSVSVRCQCQYQCQCTATSAASGSLPALISYMRPASDIVALIAGATLALPATTLARVVAVTVAATGRLLEDETFPRATGGRMGVNSDLLTPPLAPTPPLEISLSVPVVPVVWPLPFSRAAEGGVDVVDEHRRLLSTGTRCSILERPRITMIINTGINSY